MINKNKPIIQAIWADFKDLNEILISPTMIKDHMPDRILEALKCLLTTTGPQKPQRINDLNKVNQNQSSSSTSESDSVPFKVQVETSFTDSFKINNQYETVFNPNHLNRLKSLVRKGRAPLATPETISLTSNTDHSQNDSIDMLAEQDDYQSINFLLDSSSKLCKCSSDSVLQKKKTIPQFGQLRRSNEEQDLGKLDVSERI